MKQNITQNLNFIFYNFHKITVILHTYDRPKKFFYVKEKYIQPFELSRYLFLSPPPLTYPNIPIPFTLTNLKTLNTHFLQEGFSGEIARKCMVCYTTSEACTFVRMSLSLYEPHKVPLSVVQPLYLHCAAPTGRRE